MMRRLIHVDATAGWGKTTKITEDLEKYSLLVARWRADYALYLVYTKKNAETAREKLRGVVSVDNIRTLHSFCYKHLPERKPVMDGKVLEEFSERYGYGKLASGMPFKPRTRGDHILAFYYFMRNTMTDFADAYERKERDLWHYGISKEDANSFLVRWESFKREKEVIDYADILEFSDPNFDGYFLAIDEAQDFTPLMWNAVQKLIANSPKLKHILIVGDCDQVVYGFQGADARLFLEYPKELAKEYGFEYEKKTVKHVSKRVPSKPLAFALRFLEKVKDRDHSKEILPEKEGGEVLIMGRYEFLELIKKEKRKVVIQERHRHELLWWKERLLELGLPFIESEEDLKKWQAWKGLMEKEKRAYLYLWELYKKYLPPWQEYLKRREEYLNLFYENKEKWINLLDEKTKAFALHYPREPIHLTTMHREKGEEGDVVWVSGKWTNKVKPDDNERRLYFVACTRTRNILVIDKDHFSTVRLLLDEAS